MMTVSPIEMKLHCFGGLTRTIAVASPNGEDDLDVDVDLAGQSWFAKCVSSSHVGLFIGDRLVRVADAEQHTHPQ